MPARLATIDPHGFPRITPLWFVWEGRGFHMTSVVGQPHLHNLERDPRAAVCVDVEQRDAIGGVRPNRQVKGSGLAELIADDGGSWTRRITLRYVPGPEGVERAALRAAMPRALIRLRPRRLIALGTREPTVESLG